MQRNNDPFGLNSNTEHNEPQTPISWEDLLKLNDAVLINEYLDNLTAANSALLTTEATEVTEEPTHHNEESNSNNAITALETESLDQSEAIPLPNQSHFESALNDYSFVLPNITVAALSNNNNSNHQYKLNVHVNVQPKNKTLQLVIEPQNEISEDELLDITVKLSTRVRDRMANSKSAPCLPDGMLAYRQKTHIIIDFSKTVGSDNGFPLFDKEYMQYLIFKLVDKTKILDRIQAELKCELTNCRERFNQLQTHLSHQQNEQGANEDFLEDVIDFPEALITGDRSIQLDSMPEIVPQPTSAETIELNMNNYSFTLKDVKLVIRNYSSGPAFLEEKKFNFRVSVQQNKRKVLIELESECTPEEAVQAMTQFQLRMNSRGKLGSGAHTPGEIKVEKVGSTHNLGEIRRKKVSPQLEITFPENVTINSTLQFPLSNQNYIEFLFERLSDSKKFNSKQRSQMEKQLQNCIANYKRIQSEQAESNKPVNNEGSFDDMVDLPVVALTEGMGQSVLESMVQSDGESVDIPVAETTIQSMSEAPTVTNIQVETASTVTFNSQRSLISFLLNSNASEAHVANPNNFWSFPSTAHSSTSSTDRFNSVDEPVSNTTALTSTTNSISNITNASSTNSIGTDIIPNFYVPYSDGEKNKSIMCIFKKDDAGNVELKLMDGGVLPDIFDKKDMENLYRKLRKFVLKHNLPIEVQKLNRKFGQRCLTLKFSAHLALMNGENFKLAIEMLVSTRAKKVKEIKDKLHLSQAPINVNANLSNSNSTQSVAQIGSIGNVQTVTTNSIFANTVTSTQASNTNNANNNANSGADETALTRPTKKRKE